MSRVTTGLDRLLEEPGKYLTGKKIGLIVNQTSLAGDGRHSILHFRDHPEFNLHKIFAPEHGLHGTAQDMIQVADGVDPISGVPVRSLYGDSEGSLSPDPTQFEDLDALVFDVQDVGARYYTFIYTMANCMEVSRQTGTPIIVCDRPNPINGRDVEGNHVDEAFRSFVGQYPLPNRHGMTVGELARMFNDHFGIGCDLTVIPMNGWERPMWFDQTGLLWPPPSPNMPTLTTATVYPGMCLVEGTHLSEGRGTTLPFEQTGAPYIHPGKLAALLEEEKLKGVFFRPHYFRPTFHKWAGETCGGIQLHVTDREIFEPLITGIAVLKAISQLYPESFAWRTEPYEFVSDRLAIDLLYGNSRLREFLFPEKISIPDIRDSWIEDTRAFLQLRQNYLLY